jgi:hypothetical protein
VTAGEPSRRRRPNLTWWSFLLGRVESFLYGAYAGLVFCPIYNFLHRRWGARAVKVEELSKRDLPDAEHGEAGRMVDLGTVLRCQETGVQSGMIDP